MSAALRARYRAWYAYQRFLGFEAPDESFSPDFVGLHFWHRLRIRRMHGVLL